MVEQKGIQQQMWKSLLTTFPAPPLWRCRRRLSVPPPWRHCGVPPLQLRWLARAVDLLSQLSFLIEICLSLFCSHSSQIIANQMRYRIHTLTFLTKIPFIILSKHSQGLGEEGFQKKRNSTTSLNLHDCWASTQLAFNRVEKTVKNIIFLQILAWTVQCRPNPL